MYVCIHINDLQPTNLVLYMATSKNEPLDSWVVPAVNTSSSRPPNLEPTIHGLGGFPATCPDLKAFAFQNKIEKQKSVKKI